MKFIPTSLQGLWLIELEPRQDERGFLARTFCEEEFAAHGLNTRWPQCNLTLTKQRGMLRGLHYQVEPKPETKLIRCAAGAIWDVVADLRSGSPTFGRCEAFELNPRNFRQLYVPAGFAHGFQCLEDDCQVFYQMSEPYVPELARGVRWDDPTLQISWPLPDPIVSERDRKLPLLVVP
jgi:dTDP-4-dehydrorhamnose 3,5-epimerase